MSPFASLTAQSGSAEPSAFVLVVATVLAAALVVNGLRTWRGEELTSVLRHQEEHGPMTMPTVFGGRRLYQTPLGSTHASVLVGAAGIAIGVTELARRLLGQPDDWWLLAVVAWPAGIAGVLGFLYTLVYFWFGVPDRLRPPAQRGWRMGKHGYELIRPEAVPPSERPAPPVEWPEERDLW